MKYIKILVFALFFAPTALFAASSNEFMVAAQLLSAAKNADIQQVQILINNGADVNYVDSTGLSLVCTALMNNDMRAAQILQMYGADASKCDQQIKKYNSKNKTEGSGGLFGGLSSAQSLTLAAAGAAVVVGGLFLLTDVFDPGNENSGGSSSGGDRPGGGGGNSGGGATEGFVTPYGPAYLTTDGKIAYTTAAYNQNLASWDPSAGGIREKDFNYFRPDVQETNNYLTDGITVPMQNYLLMMHGYSPFAHGYMGKSIFRNDSRLPVIVSNDAGGGAPVKVLLITENGINPTGSAARAEGVTYADSAGANANTYLVDKYLNYNNPNNVDGTITLGAEQTGFDFSGSGTAMNPFASANENALAKIIAGWEAGGRANGDLYGFVPNGLLGVYRTGGGKIWVDVENPTSGTAAGNVVNGSGNASGAIGAGDTITINGVTYKITLAIADAGVTDPTITINGKTYKLPANSTLLKGTCTSETSGACDDVSDIAIYKGTDGFYYVNSTGGNMPDSVYVINDNNLYIQKELKDGDVRNFEVMYKAPKSDTAVLVNAAVNPDSRSLSYLTMSDLPALFKLFPSLSDNEIFANQINNYYDKDNTDAASTQGGYANSMFNNYGAGMAIIVNPAGEFEFGVGDGKSMSILDATFENYAPAVYDNNLEHLFMTIVAVSNTNGTEGADSIGGYGNGSSYGPIQLSKWVDTKGTTDTSDDVIYSSRKCGVAGLGINGIDPWCFSAAGATTEMAAASAAGAVAAVKGAFGYMSNEQIFTLLALTADGPYLGTDNNGTAFTKEGLVSYLKSLYVLPPEYNESTLTTDEYLKKFAEVYGYGLINLERATMPNKKIYYYDGTNIVSTNGKNNAYWRAATQTVFRSSAAFSPRAAIISAPFFDFLESVDGEMSMPRVWKNEFALGVQDKRGLYMGDVLGELKTRETASMRHNFGKFGFSMAMSDRAYADNFNGLDNLQFDYADGNFNMRAQYQHYLTDGASRFTGLSNPILALASNAMSSDLGYNFGNWSFGARAFSGAITDEELLDSDPTISSQYMPARLGLMQGAQSSVAWSNGKFGFNTSIGMAHETDTILGAQTGGLLSLGQGDTTYVDTELRYAPRDNMAFTMRSTFARTTSDATGEFILGMSDVNSNAFAFGADIGNFSFAVSRPLAVSRGSMQYAHADYDVVETDDGKYELVVSDTYVANLNLSPEKRETRLNASYRYNFGPFTDGALGFIYRINPNNTDEFGNESIFMMKMTHRLGI